LQVFLSFKGSREGVALRRRCDGCHCELSKIMCL
jgi:hypothetical protein